MKHPELPASLPAPSTTPLATSLATSSLAALQRYEYEARRLRAQHAQDLSLRLVLSLDLLLRRAACRIAAALTARVTPCR